MESMNAEEKRQRQKEASKRWRIRHVEEIRAKERSRYAERKEEVAARKRLEYAEDRENKIETVRRWQRRNPEKVKASWRERHLWRWYRLTIAEFDSLFLGQGSRCGICGSESPIGQKHWHIDHDHSTGKIRGILCYYCNLLLGHAKDNTAILRAAIEYLE